MPEEHFYCEHVEEEIDTINGNINGEWIIKKTPAECALKQKFDANASYMKKNISNEKHMFQTLY